MISEFAQGGWNPSGVAALACGDVTGDRIPDTVYFNWRHDTRKSFCSTHHPAHSGREIKKSHQCSAAGKCRLQSYNFLRGFYRRWRQ